MSKNDGAKSERILNAAEELFALHGFDGVTMRQIATKAKVDVALANYHFGKKLEVFKAVFNRRAEMLNQVRRDVLHANQKESSGKEQSLEQIIEAFLRPLKLAQETGDPGWRNYLALLANVMVSPVWSREMMPHVYDKLVSEFVEALQKALPKANEEDIHWCYHYVAGALALTFAQTGRIDRLSGGKCLSSDFEAAYDRMIPFVAAGFRAVCDSR
jgi:AcrR family transcriptional regulator